MTDTPRFTGTWRARLWYPTKDDTAEEMTENDMAVHQVGHDLVFQSTPNKEGSYTIIRLSLDGDVATGTWYENTSEAGEFGGVMYSGAGQLIVREDKKQMAGLWAGAGVDPESGKLKLYTGRWELAFSGH